MWAIGGKMLDENKKLVNNTVIYFAWNSSPSLANLFVKAAGREAG